VARHSQQQAPHSGRYKWRRDSVCLSIPADSELTRPNAPPFGPRLAVWAMAASQTVRLLTADNGDKSVYQATCTQVSAFCQWTDHKSSDGAPGSARPTQANCRDPFCRRAISLPPVTDAFFGAGNHGGYEPQRLSNSTVTARMVVRRSAPSARILRLRRGRSGTMEHENRRPALLSPSGR
jgi:hypothetical protein